LKAGAGAEIFDKLEPEPESEPHKNGPAPQHCILYTETSHGQKKPIIYSNRWKCPRIYSRDIIWLETFYTPPPPFVQAFPYTQY
jgi:hypothetical protein